jgi:hypothetical protein
MPEPDRSVRYTPSLTPNPERPPDDVPEKILRESSDYFSFIEGVDEVTVVSFDSDVSDPFSSGKETVMVASPELVSSGLLRHLPVGWKEFGVPQGCATSCGTSTLTLSHLTEPSRLESELTESSGCPN